jgi:hypothetical protein
MKRIFTFLFFAGLMTSAMAQNSRNAQYRNQTDNSQSTAYANNGQGYGQSNGAYTQNNQANNGYSRSNGYQQNEQGYNHNNENSYGNSRRFDERNDEPRFRNNVRFNQSAYGYERKWKFERYRRGRFNARFSVRFGQPSCY